jgi:hypothetical protein
MSLNMNELTAHIESIISKEDYRELGTKSVVCVMKLKNGFEIVGHSAPFHVNDYVYTKGRTCARADAINKLIDLFIFHKFMEENPIN